MIAIRSTARVHPCPIYQRLIPNSLGTDYGSQRYVRALRGPTLYKLHHDWRAGTLVGALTSGRNIGLLGIPTIFSTHVVMDGPLLQRSTYIRPSPIVGQFDSLEVTMSPQIPNDFTGARITMKQLGTGQWRNLSYNATEPGADSGVPNDVFCAVKPDREGLLAPLYFADDSLAQVVSGCRGTCKSRIRAPALAMTSCIFTPMSVDYFQAYAGRDYQLGIVAFPINQLMFTVSSSLILDQDGLEKINLVTGHNENTDCKGIFNLTACTLESAVGEYDVTITNGTVTSTYRVSIIVSLPPAQCSAQHVHKRRDGPNIHAS